MSKLQDVKLTSVEFVKAKEMTKGEIIAGVYLEAKKGNYESPTFMIETTDGRIGLNGTKKLTALLARVPIGANVEIEYLGSEVLKSGKYKGKEFHDFAVRSDQVMEPTAVASDEETLRDRARAAKKTITG